LPNGRVVLAGSSVVSGLTPDGHFDSTGSLPTDPVTPLMAVGGIAAGPDGSVGVTATMSSAQGNPHMPAPTVPAVYRLRPDLTLDPDFGVGGRLTSGLGFAVGPVVVQPNGKIVVGAGQGQSANYLDSDFLVERLTETGAPDPTFGTNGVVTVGFQNATG